MKYEIINYDVWGNKKEGYEINQMFYTGVKIDIPADATIKDIKKAMFDAGYLSKTGLKTKMGEAYFSDENIIGLELLAQKYGNKPFCELHLQQEEK